MPVFVNVQTVHPRKLAAVRREVAPGAVGSAWRTAVDKVWEFIRSPRRAPDQRGAGRSERYGFSAFTNSFATLAAPLGPENGPEPFPDTSTTLVF